MRPHPHPDFLFWGILRAYPPPHTHKDSQEPRVCQEEKEARH